MGAFIDLLGENLDRAYLQSSWHGPNLRGSIRGVNVAVAAWRPGPGRRSIWEIVVHAAYWKYAAWRRLQGEKRGSFAYQGSNWFPRPNKGDAAMWTADVRLLDRYHQDLVEAVKSLREGDLLKSPPGAKTTIQRMVLGVAAHDVYHAGQIQLLKRLYRQRSEPRP